MNEIFSSDLIRLVLRKEPRENHTEYWVETIEVKLLSGWHSILTGTDGNEFVTTQGSANATQFEVTREDLTAVHLQLSFQGKEWSAREEIILEPGSPIIKRRQTYTVHKPFEGALSPGFLLKAEPGLRYTFTLKAHEKPLAEVPALRSAVDWALPFPFHAWHSSNYVAIYGLDKRTSAGTLDYQPSVQGSNPRLGVYYPDVFPQNANLYEATKAPQTIEFKGDTQVTFDEIIGGKVLEAGEDGLFEAERLAASILLHGSPRQDYLESAAESLTAFYSHCDLWEPDAFGTGRGWFLHMWIHTASGRGEKDGPKNTYFDLGWGEGIAVEMWMAAILRWKRTGERSLLTYVDAMTPSIDLFKRGQGVDALYYDRSNRKMFGDFGPGPRVWTHSVGHTASQLIQLYQLAPDYPKPEIRQKWLDAALSIGRYLARSQKSDGDLLDIFSEDDLELNTKPHRITARAVVCGLWTRLGQVTGEKSWVERALRLARFLAPEIDQYNYYNQMIDGYERQDIELTDGEAAYYILEGLSVLYAETHDPQILSLCRKAAADGIAWTYFYDLPKAHNSVARGGQCCRMDDAPLLYPIGPAKSMEPLLSLARTTGDAFFKKMAEEAASFISQWQIKAPGKPWDGGMAHAVSQFDGKYWGPDLDGQVDTGMSTGNSLAALERWLLERNRK